MAFLDQRARLPLLVCLTDTTNKRGALRHSPDLPHWQDRLRHCVRVRQIYATSISHEPQIDVGFFGEAVDQGDHCVEDFAEGCIGVCGLQLADVVAQVARL